MPASMKTNKNQKKYQKKKINIKNKNQEKSNKNNTQFRVCARTQ